MKTPLSAAALVIALASGPRSMAEAPGTVLWTYDVGRQIVSSPAVGPDGTVYVGTDIAFYAITNSGANGSNKWTFQAGLSFTCSPSVGSDGVIYFGDPGSGTMHALNADGSERWTIPLQQQSQCSPAIAFDRTVYLVAGGQLYANSPTGAIKWQLQLDDGVGGYPLSPAIGRDGTVYAASYLGRMLYSVRPDGTQKWSVPLAYGAGASVAISSEGNTYVAAGLLYAFSPEGTNLWSANANGDGGMDGPPVVGRDGSIYVSASSTHTLYAFTPSGALKWQAFDSVSRGLPSTAPAIDAAGNICYCVSNSIVSLSPQGQVLWTIFAGFDAQGFYYAATSPVIGPDGTLYAALNTKLYAVATGTNGPANSSWPMFQQNARHTGKIEKPSLQQPKKRADANFQFQIYAQVSQTQTVQTSTDLTAWTSLTNVTITNVPMDVVDLSASNFLSRFYRVYSP